MIGTATVFLWLASGVSAQTRSGGAPAPVPVPESPGFSVLMPFRGGFVTVPLSPSGAPLVPDSGGCRRRPLCLGLPLRSRRLLRPERRPGADSTTATR